MSDIFENDLEDENINLSALEDSDTTETIDEELVFEKPLYVLRMNYSSETVYARNDRNLDIKPGDFVFAVTRYGKDMVQIKGIAAKPIGVKLSEVVVIERKAVKEDLKKMEEFKAKEAEAFRIFKEKAAAHRLDMKLVTVHFLADEQKVIFFFCSDSRVDFRELVKDLVSVFKMRIELRQIGIRDEARITGGLGMCGRPLCCHGISDKLRPVSIRMAKDQNLSLNSLKISGQCGRLLCCLSYEFDWYTEAKKRMPQEGLHIVYDGTNFRITEVNFITSMVKMLGEDGRLLEINAKRFAKENGKWRID